MRRIAGSVALLATTVSVGACTQERQSAGTPAVASTAATPPPTTDLEPPPTEPVTTEPVTTEREPPPTEPVTTESSPTTTVAERLDPPPVDRLDGLPLALEPWFDAPLLTTMAVQPGEEAIFLGSQTGEVWRIPPDSGAGTEPVLALDLTADVSPWENGSERGLLGIAFDPSGGRLFVSYTDGAIDSHIESFAVAADGTVDGGSRREVLFVEQPGLGHKGGGLVFEPDGTLYATLGDGGASSGRDAQDNSNLLGSIIRIRPNADAPGYQVPADNPFVDDDTAAPELWATGLRNPWGFCRDAATGNLWLGDVGNHTMEEVNRLAAGQAGANFGWPAVEGTSTRQSNVPDGAIAPVFAYRHDEVGPAVIGGCVYTGRAIPELRGAYVFADITGPMFAMGADDEVGRLDVDADWAITAFAPLPDGELLVLTLYDGALLLTPAAT